MAKTKAKEDKGIGTKEVAEHLGISPKELRVHLRDGDFFEGQRSKRYTFKSLNDPVIGKLEDYIEGKKKKSTPKADKKSSKKSKDKKGKGKKKRKLKKKSSSEDAE